MRQTGSGVERKSLGEDVLLTVRGREYLVHCYEGRLNKMPQYTNWFRNKRNTELTKQEALGLFAGAPDEHHEWTNRTSMSSPERL